VARTGGRRGVTPPDNWKFLLFFHLKGRKIKLQQGSHNSFPKDTELKKVFLEQAIK